MIGAIIGDIVGSVYEFHNLKSKNFEFLGEHNYFTDDTVMSLAVAKAVAEYKKDGGNLGLMATDCMRELGAIYPKAGYGPMFRQWLRSDNPKPYFSYGNGAAMRVSACGYAASSIEEAKSLSKAVTEITHNHPEGLKGAEAIAVAVYLAKTGSSKEEIKRYVQENYYNMDFTLDGIRDRYKYHVSCQGSVPQALEAFFESTNFEDAIRNAISIGGDSDTIGAMTGAVAEAYYGVPKNIRNRAENYLEPKLLSILLSFEKAYPPRAERE